MRFLCPLAKAIHALQGDQPVAVEAKRRALKSRAMHVESLEPRLVMAEDTFEHNDTIGSARSLGTIQSTITYNNLGLHDSDDWFRFRLGRHGIAADAVTMAFTNAQGNLDLELYDSTGELLASSTTNGNSETTPVAGLPVGTYFVHVFGRLGATNPNYSLTFTRTLPPPDDAREDNDAIEDAYDMGTLTSATTLSALALADTQDWYRFTTAGRGVAGVGGNPGNQVTIDFQHSQGNLALELYDSSGQKIRSSNSTVATNQEVISLVNLPASTYYARVWGVNGAFSPNYTLTVRAPVATVPPPPPPPTSPPPPPPGPTQFDIALNLTGFTPSQQAIFNQAAIRWESIIVGDLPNESFAGQVVDDLLISGSSTAIDGVGGILGQAAPLAFRTTTQLPYYGVMDFDSADLASMEADGSLLAVILHEMGHVLGIGTLWTAKGLLSGAVGSNPTFTGAQAISAYNTIFGLTATSVPVENTGGPGTRNAHWRETTFNKELMTGFLNPPGPFPLSRITIGSLADIGYTVNFTPADSYTPPLMAGLLGGGEGSGSAGSAASYSLGPPHSLVSGAALLSSPRSLYEPAEERIAIDLASTVQSGVRRRAAATDRVLTDELHALELWLRDF